MTPGQMPPELWIDLQRFAEKKPFLHRAQSVMSHERGMAYRDHEEALIERDLQVQVARHVASHCVGIVIDRVTVEGRVRQAECAALKPDDFYELIYRIYCLGQHNGRMSLATMGDVK